MLYQILKHKFHLEYIQFKESIMFSSKICRINYGRSVVLFRGAVQLSRALNMILSVKHIFIE